MQFHKRMRVTFLGSLLALASCSSSFVFKAEALDLSKVSSAYVVIGPKADLATQSESQIRELVLPGRLEKYPFFAQFEPDGAESWRRMDTGRGPLEPRADKASLKLKVPKHWIELYPDHQIALIVRYSDRSWRCARDPMVPKADAEYVITPDDLQPRR